MEQMLCDINKTTQPIRNHRVFNNWDFVSKGWYIVCKSNDLKKGKTISKKLCGHQLALFRTASGKACAIDAFCSHMGMDMAKGKVVGETLRCHFHHWKFDGDGKCVEIPCLKHIPQHRMNMNAYPVEEKYGFIWVYSDLTAPDPVFEIEEFKGKEILFTSLKPFRRVAHPHITMMNSIDEQHMRTVHLFDMDLKAKIEEKGTRFYLRFFGEVCTNIWQGKLQKFFFGSTYRSSVLLVDGCIGLLTTMIDIKFLNRFTVPRGYYIFSQTFEEKGKTVVHPIILTERRKGIFGFLFSWSLIQVNRLIMKFLAYQDGRTVYGHLRFRQDGLLPVHDEATARWISFTNRCLKPSLWSVAKPAPEHLENHEVPVLQKEPTH